jgi:alpha-tubulin suppressor-like RCC1 family protein
MGISTGFKRPDGADIGIPLVERSYLIDRYPELADTFKQAGLWTWGAGVHGLLGNNTTTHQSSPVQTVSGGTNWTQIASGLNHTAAIKTDGTLWIWGSNSDGQLGNGNITSQSSPVQTVSGGTNWKQVVCSYQHTVAIKTDGTLWTWGRGDFGSLGNSTTASRSSPGQTITAGTNWKQLASGIGQFSAAIKTDGTLWIWGRNFEGQLGDNTTVNKSSPVQTISQGTNWKSVAIGPYFTAAIKTDGTLWTWGYNSYGQLGDNTTVNKSSPVQTISQGTNWKQIACSVEASAAIKTDGTLWTWGRNRKGQLGDNSTTNKSSPVQTVSGGTNWKLVNGAGYYPLAIKTDGTLWAWGENHVGQLGDNSTTNKSSPVQTVSGGTNWKSVSGGLVHTAAIRDDSADPI